MISDILEFNSEDGVKENKHKHPTIKQVQKQMKGFDESLVMYVYHKLNGREQEACTYLQEWEDEQEELKQSFGLINELNKLNSASNIIEDVSIAGQHTPPNADGDITQ
jgi:hypothetical protein